MKSSDGRLTGALLPVGVAAKPGQVIKAQLPCGGSVMRVKMTDRGQDGLYAHEKRFAIPFVMMSTVFFIGGVLFSHYVVFPAMWRFFASFSTETVEFAPRIEPVFSLYVRMGLGLGAVFEMPTLIMFLARVGLVTPRFLIRNTKYAILVIFVVAALVTPSRAVSSAIAGRSRQPSALVRAICTPPGRPTRAARTPGSF